MNAGRRLMRLGWVGGLVLFGIGTVAAAEADKAALDRQVFEVLKDVHNAGADLHNAGDPAGCFRLYQGGLMALKPILGHRPEAQQIIDRGLKSAEVQPTPPQRSFALHKTFEELRNLLRASATNTLPPPKQLDTKPPTNPAPAGPGVPPPTVSANNPMGPTVSLPTTSQPNPAPIVAPPVTVNPAPATNPPAGDLPPVPSFDAPSLPANSNPQTPPPAPAFEVPAPKPAATSTDVQTPVTLWKQLGGQAPVERIVEDFVAISLPDAKANWARDGKVKLDDPTIASVKRKLVGFVSAITDGTVPYTGAAPRDLQKEFNITDAEFAVMVAGFKAALEKNQVGPAVVQQLLQKMQDARVEAMGPAVPPPSP